MFPDISVDWPHPRRAWLKRGAFAGAQITELAGTPMRVAGARSPAGNEDTYDLVLQIAGSGPRLIAGREALQETGDLMLVNSGLPFDVTHPAPWRLLFWNLPRDALAPMLAAPDRGVPHRICRGDGLGTVLGTYARALAGADRIDVMAQHSLLMYLCGLVGLAVGASPAARESRRQTYRAVRRQQILTYVETHLHDHRLTAQRVADELQMSPRWLHALCEDGEISFAAWVARRRLEECRKLLDDPAHDHLSIAEIAFQAGFNDLSTFNRRFRARYGISPRDARRLRALRGGELEEMPRAGVIASSRSSAAASRQRPQADATGDAFLRRGGA
jgi:AraC-like DNA-binding protein